MNQGTSVYLLRNTKMRLLTTRSQRSSPRRGAGNTFQEPSSSTSSLPLLMRLSFSPVPFAIYLALVQGPYWNLSAAVPPRAVDHREGGRRQQLRSRSLHHRQGADRGDRVIVFSTCYSSVIKVTVDRIRRMADQCSGLQVCPRLIEN